jgi:hypothetical protein
MHVAWMKGDDVAVDMFVLEIVSGNAKFAEDIEHINKDSSE